MHLLYKPLFTPPPPPPPPTCPPSSPPFSIFLGSHPRSVAVLHPRGGRGGLRTGRTVTADPRWRIREWEKEQGFLFFLLSFIFFISSFDPFASMFRLSSSLSFQPFQPCRPEFNRTYILKRRCGTRSECHWTGSRTQDPGPDYHVCFKTGGSFFLFLFLITTSQWYWDWWDWRVCFGTAEWRSKEEPEGLSVVPSIYRWGHDWLLPLGIRYDIIK